MHCDYDETIYVKGKAKNMSFQWGRIISNFAITAFGNIFIFAFSLFEKWTLKSDWLCKGFPMY